MTTKSEIARLHQKRRQVAERIKEVAPMIAALVGMLDEVKVDLLLIALSGAFLPANPGE
jgi:hypothetical protein